MPLGDDLTLAFFLVQKITQEYTPQEFLDAVKTAVEEAEGDPEEFHIKSDVLMEELLTVLGYDKAVALIKMQKRWYS